MNDHNLDDLIIDTIAPKNNKTKSLLTIIALLIIVLIVAIILTKTLLKTPQTDTLSFEENMSEMIAPELKLQAQEEVKVTEVSKPKEEPSLAHIIEEKITGTKPVEEKVETAKPAQDIENPITKIEELPESSIKETISTPKETLEEAPTPTIAKPVTQTTHEPKVTKKPTRTVTVKKETKKPVTKPVKTPTATRKNPKTTSTGKYYVQVSSFKSATPSRRLLSVIKSSGFTSHVTAPDRTGYKKLLIGPYKTRTDVDKARDIVRDRILKSAFVVER